MRWCAKGRDDFDVEAVGLWFDLDSVRLHGQSGPVVGDVCCERLKINGVAGKAKS